MATAQPVHDRLRDTISRLIHRGLGVEDYWRAVSDALDGAVPSEGSCLMTMDPATMLPTAEFVENGLPADAIAGSSRSSYANPTTPSGSTWRAWAEPQGASATSQWASSTSAGRHREVRRPGGYPEELGVVLSSSTGTWGALTVFREKDRPYFSPSEVRVVTSLTGAGSEQKRRRKDSCELGPRWLDAQPH
jgi:hypothetical protein